MPFFFCLVAVLVIMNGSMVLWIPTICGNTLVKRLKSWILLQKTLKTKTATERFVFLAVHDWKWKRRQV